MGCKANQYDTQSMRETLQYNGYTLVDEEMSGQQTDLYLINTCTVTNVADQKARQAIRRAIRQHPNAKVLVTGCYAESDREAIEEIPGVTFVFGNREKADFQDYLDILNAEMPSFYSSRASLHQTRFLPLSRCSTMLSVNTHASARALVMLVNVPVHLSRSKMAAVLFAPTVSSPTSAVG